MASKATEVGMLIQLGKTAEAKAIVLAAYVKARGTMRAAAKALGVSEVTFWRWVAKLGCEKDVERTQARLRTKGLYRDGRKAGSKKRLATMRTRKAGEQEVA